MNGPQLTRGGQGRRDDDITLPSLAAAAMIVLAIVGLIAFAIGGGA